MIDKINNILLVDDDVATIFLNKWIINKINFQGNLATAHNGQEALDLLTSSRPDSAPFLILLDINMPIMDGWEFLEKYKLVAPEQRKDLIILLISDEYDHKKVEQLQYDFVIGCLEKPIQKEGLSSLIQRYFS